jgi:hypothetical protein
MAAFKGQKNGQKNISNEIFNFLCSTTFELLSQTKRNSANDCDFFKVHNFCCGRTYW